MVLPGVAAWEFHGRTQVAVLHEVFTCEYPAGDCAASLHSLQHVPVGVAKLARETGGRTCVRESLHPDLRLEVSVDVRCLPGLPSNVTCATIAARYPAEEAWPHGYGAFDPLRRCAGFDPDLLEAICTLRCATPGGGAPRHAELFCAYHLDPRGRHGLRERGVVVDFCDLSAGCMSATHEESMLTCFAAGAQVGEDIRSGSAFATALDVRIWLAVGALAVVCCSACRGGGACRRGRAAAAARKPALPLPPGGAAAAGAAGGAAAGVWGRRFGGEADEGEGEEAGLNPSPRVASPLGGVSPEASDRDGASEEAFASRPPFGGFGSSVSHAVGRGLS